MADVIETQDLIRLLATRIEFMRALHESTKDKRELVDTLELSDSAVYKGLRELREAKLITGCEDGYRPTWFGMLATYRFEELYTVCDGYTVFGSFDRDGPVPVDIVLDGRMTFAREYAPHAPETAMADLFADVDRHRLVTDVGSPRHAATVFDGLGDELEHAEVVMTDDALAHLREADPDLLADALATEALDLYETEWHPRVKVAVVTDDGDRTVGIGLPDNRRFVKGFVETDAQGALAWAEEFIDDLLADAEPIEEEALAPQA